RARQALHQLRRMDRRAVRSEQRAEVGPAADQRGRIGRRELAVVVRAETPRSMVVDLLTKTGEVRGEGGDLDGAAECPVALDPLFDDDPLDLVQGCEHRTLHRNDAVPSVAARGRVATTCKQCRAPAAIATRRTEADDLA